MFPKLLAVIVAFGAVGCILLVNRQQRIEAAHEMSLIHKRLAEHERAIWRLRGDIAQRCSPEQIRLARERLGQEWRPMVLSVPRGPYERSPRQSLASHRGIDSADDVDDEENPGFGG